MKKKVLFLGYKDSSLINYMIDRGYEVQQTADKIDVDYLKNNEIDFIVSFGYRFIIQQSILDYLPGKVINLHISLLPWNKGADPNLWSFIEDSPKGVTIHEVDKGLDTGAILVQKELYFDSKETLRTSYSKLVEAIEELFKVNWDDLFLGKIKAKPQELEGSSHLAREKNDFISFLGNSWLDTRVGELKELYSQFKSETAN